MGGRGSSSLGAKFYGATYRRRVKLTKEISDLDKQIKAIRQSAEKEAEKEARDEYKSNKRWGNNTSIEQFNQDRKLYYDEALSETNHGELMRKKKAKERELKELGRGQIRLF